MAFLDFHPLSPISNPFHIFFCSSSPWTPTLWCGPLSWGDGLPGFCLTTVECSMRGRITADEDAYEALALAGKVSELSNAATPEHSDFVLSCQLNRKEDMCVAFRILHVLCEGR